LKYIQPKPDALTNNQLKLTDFFIKAIHNQFLVNFACPSYFKNRKEKLQKFYG